MKSSSCYTGVRFQHIFAKTCKRIISSLSLCVCFHTGWHLFTLLCQVHLGSDIRSNKACGLSFVHHRWDQSVCVCTSGLASVKWQSFFLLLDLSPLTVLSICFASYFFLRSFKLLRLVVAIFGLTHVWIWQKCGSIY